MGAAQGRLRGPAGSCGSGTPPPVLILALSAACPRLSSHGSGRRNEVCQVLALRSSAGLLRESCGKRTGRAGGEPWNGSREGLGEGPGNDRSWRPDVEGKHRERARGRAPSSFLGPSGRVWTGNSHPRRQHPSQPPSGPSCLVTQPFVIWGSGATCQRSDGIATGLPPLLTLLIHLCPLI